MIIFGDWEETCFRFPAKEGQHHRLDLRCSNLAFRMATLADLAARIHAGSDIDRGDQR